MKARVVVLALLALVGRPGAAEPAQDLKFTWADDSNPTALAIRQSGTRLIDILGGQLIAETDRLLATVGLDEAVELVHLQNVRLPQPTPGRPKLTEFRFTSNRIRNPRNAPDAADRAALDRVRDLIRSGSPAANQPLVQRIERPGAPDEWRVYRPLAVLPNCLLCHGRSDSLQPRVASSLHRRFPEDGAVDYGPYDWRGVVRVSYEVPAPAPGETAR